jgi:replication-associated recombination protein RarA
MQNTLEFPQPLAEKYRPERFDHFIGLDKPLKIMRKLTVNPFSSAWIFTGPSGTGKTTLALAFAKELPAELHHIPSQACNVAALENVRRTCQYVPAMGHRMHLVLVDEADRMTPAAQLALLSMLDATNPAPDTIWIFTCNSTEGLEARFLSRCRTLEFTSHGLAKEISTYLEEIWETETSAEKPDFLKIARESRNNIRAALMLLEMELMAA